MNPMIVAGMVGLGIYAVLLGVGGVIGYKKAGSRPSLIAGSASAVVALLSLALVPMGGFGFYPGLVLAIALAGMFGSRFYKTKKFMPSGMLLAASLVMVVLMGLCLRELFKG